MRGALLLLAMMAATATPLPAFARIQPEIVCIDTEMEFPVACDEDDDDYGRGHRLNSSTQAMPARAYSSRR